MTNYILQPYVGTNLVTFEMTPHQVEMAIGRPQEVGQNSLGERDENRGNVSVRYSLLDNKVCEISFLPSSKLLFKGKLLFEEMDLIDWLMTFDPKPYEFVGFLIFFELGITVTGFHESDESQKAITIFRKGRWDEIREDAELYKKPKGKISK